MNLHETLTYRHSIREPGPVALPVQEGGVHTAPHAATLMARQRRHHLLALCIAIFGVLLVPAGASAATCDWHGLIDSAYNDRQITTHTTACYQRALAELPADADGYAPAVRARILQAMRRDGDLAAQNSAGRNARFLASGLTAEPAAAVAVRGPVTNLLTDLGPAHVEDVPTPVLALGGAAVLLLLAGLVTSVTRVRTARRATR